MACGAMELAQRRRTIQKRVDVERFRFEINVDFLGYFRFTIEPSMKNGWFSENLMQASDAAPPRKLYEGDLEDAEERAFTSAGYNSSIALAHRLAKASTSAALTNG